MKNLAIFLFLFLVVTIGVFTFKPLSETNNPLLEQSIYILASLMASVSAFLALRVYGKGPRFTSILCLALGLTCWLIADTLFIYMDFVLHNLPYPSIADYFYLIAYILLFIGLMLEVKLSDISWKKMSKRVYILAGLFSSALLSAFSYLSLFSAYSPEATLGENIVTIGYTVGDIFLVITGFFILLIVWEYRGGKASKVWLALFLGFLATLVADLMYAIYTDEFTSHTGFIYALSQYFYIGGYLFITYGLLFLRSTLQAFQKRAMVKPSK